ncbi:fibronectin-binding protein [Staphylococcus aureus]|nr:fibronectin-binding protein [Staphylococcus aureus]
MKGFSLCDLSSIVQTIFGKCLVYCFKLDDFEFNLKNKYKKYKPCVSRVQDDLRAIYSSFPNDKIPN